MHGVVRRHCMDYMVCFIPQVSFNKSFENYIDLYVIFTPLLLYNNNLNTSVY